MERTRDRVVLKDTTMREGLDVPGVSLDSGQKKALLEKLAETGITEAELVSPGHFDRDLQFIRTMGSMDPAVSLSGLIYGHNSSWRDQVIRARDLLDRIDLLIPLADSRPPVGRDEKSARMREALGFVVEHLGHAGIGFPHATQVEQDFLLEMCRSASHSGAERITIYDTNGSSDPWAVADLVEKVRGVAGGEICFHAHNDLGLATANSIAAVRAGATCLDVTVNGLGDRAGNASLEQVALALHIQGVRHGVRLEKLRELSRLIAEMTMMPVSGLAPVVGDFIFCHKSPGHLATPELFEPFDPALIGGSRKVCKN